MVLNMNKPQSIEEILKNYRSSLSQQMGLILAGKHRLDVKTADRYLADEATQAIQDYIKWVIETPIPIYLTKDGGSNQADGIVYYLEELRQAQLKRAGL